LAGAADENPAAEPSTGLPEPRDRAADIAPGTPSRAIDASALPEDRPNGEQKLEVAEGIA
jgi:hypothetical protein